MGALLVGVLGVLWLGGVAYCLLALWAARRFRFVSRPAEAGSFTPFVSLLKPLSGLERDLECNLETFFLQDYPRYEILFAVNHPEDPALLLVDRLRRRHPHVPVRVVFASRPPYPNAKVYSLEKMTELARADLLVISDSDVFVGSDYLRAVVRPFADPKVGVNTCVYRGMPGNTLWSRLEALAMSSSFMPGVLVAWALEGMKFALGPTMAIRRGCLEAIGGFAAMANYLADDFVLGHWAAREGYEVALSSYVLNHQVLGESFRSTFQHRLRWARSTRCSRPWGYVGEAFTHPLAPALGLLALAPQSPACQAILAATVLLRWLVAWSVAGEILHDPNLRRSWWLVPAQDLLEFVVWCCGFLGRTVSWRGIRYEVGQDGCFVPVLEAASRTVAEHELAAAGSHFMDAAGRK